MKKNRVTTVKKYNLKSGEIRYEFSVYLGVDPLTGKQKRTTKRGFKNRKEAELALARIKFEVANGTYRQVSVETYLDIYNLWITNYEKTVEESTFIKTIGIFKNHINPALGSYKIEKITIDICQSNLNLWAEKLKNFRMVKSYASKVFSFAVKRGYLQSNPFTYVDAPMILSKKRGIINDDEKENFYTKEQLLNFLEALEHEKNVKAFTLFRLLAFSGMRKGEALALTWNDLNFSTQELRINKALSRGKDNKLYVKTTKTGIARSIKLDEKTILILKRWEEEQKNSTSFFTTDRQTSALIFSNENGEYLQPTKTRKWMLHIQEKYNFEKITTHGLRHTHCSLLFEAGASLKEVQDRLGHSDIQTTMNIYAHVSKQARDEAIKKFSNYVEL
ncbi:site-specific integrase [Exiguobacterium antarcticum]|uniref:site-specific integrase n=1 Tax=Exiguobacterium antarcticum TaxID=132920 RepID=UPI00047C04E8|nr:site-specific integrase [Exiguobacterium antarcticum]